jgi:hypothetical protein
VRNHLAEAYERNEEAEKAVAESRKTIEMGERFVAAAKKQGASVDEPSWSVDARKRIERLGAKG